MASFRAEDAVAWGLTGACLRGSGVDWDMRKAQPYCGYEKYDFEVPLGQDGDVYARYRCRMEEMRQSLRIIEQALDRLPDGPVQHRRSQDRAAAALGVGQQHGSGHPPFQAVDRRV